ncbi:MAG: formate dehydrogenase accessory sulfurtransferase FdhD, partial [Dehalococcoidia bacterium]
PLSGRIVMVSGRASYELAQKCIAAGVPILCAVSAPSSLAIAVARRFDLTLIGFLRGERFNLYHDAGRIQDLETA